MSEELYKLPDEWRWAELAEVVEIGSDQVLPKRQPNETFNYVALENVELATGRLIDFAPTRGADIASNKYSFTPKHVLYGKLRPYLQKALVPDFEGVSATDLLPLRPNPEVLDRRFLWRWLLSYDVLEYVTARQTGVKMPRLRTGDLELMPVPLPPLPEQHRIVEKLERLLAESRTAREALDRVPALLKRFRQSVLAKAFRGELTEPHPLSPSPDEEHVRRGGTDEEPASVLLERIREERRRKWEEGKGARGKKYVEPEPPDTSDLPELPEGWCWVTLSLLGELARGKSKHRPRDAKHLYGGPYPFVQTGDIARANGVITTYSQTYSDAGLAQSRLWPTGTMCITIAANIGDTAILGFDGCFPDSVVGFVADGNVCDGRYVEYFMRTAKDNLEQFAPATAQKNINLGTLQVLAVPLASLAEQRRIVAKIESLFAQAEAIERAVEIARRRAEKVDQAVLARAFRGEL